MPTIEQENAVIEQLDKTSPEAWLALVRYIARQLIEDGQQRFLAEVICREAQRRAKDKPHSFPSDELALVLSELGLKLTLADPPERN